LAMPRIAKRFDDAVTRLPRLWQKAHKVELHAVVTTPAEAITLWKRSRSAGCSSTGERGRLSRLVFGAGLDRHEARRTLGRRCSGAAGEVKSIQDRIPTGIYHRDMSHKESAGKLER